MLEIEHKFLVHSKGLKLPAAFKFIKQWYIMRSEGRSLRVRKKDEHYTLTLKVGKGVVRHEIERNLDSEEAHDLIGAALEAPIVKKRHRVRSGQTHWEVDVFEGRNEGLVMAEVELSEPGEKFSHPRWLGPEVTGDSRFQNANLAHNPVENWREDYDALLAE